MTPSSRRSSGDGNNKSPGFSIASGVVCELTLEIRNAAFGSTGRKDLTGTWSATQTGPGGFSGQSPKTGALVANVVP